MAIEVENPYNEPGQFHLRIIESTSKTGTIKNPFSNQANMASSSDYSLASLFTEEPIVTGTEIIKT